RRTRRNCWKLLCWFLFQQPQALTLIDHWSTCEKAIWLAARRASHGTSRSNLHTAQIAPGNQGDIFQGRRGGWYCAHAFAKRYSGCRSAIYNHVFKMPSIDIFIYVLSGLHESHYVTQTESFWRGLDNCAGVFHN